MPDHKEFTIEFFTGQVGEDGDVGDVLSTLSMNQTCPVFELHGKHYEIRDLRGAEDRSFFSGVFAKFRGDNIPHAGRPGAEEREIGLDDDDEGLIEKNHFIYYRQHGLLLYQRNGNGSKVGLLEKYLTDFQNETVVFHPVLQPNATRRLMRGRAVPKSVNVSFARPTNPEMYPADNWSHRLMELLSEAGGVRMSIRISSDGRSRDPDKRHLGSMLKRSLTAIVDSGAATVARMEVEEDGFQHPIDLIADRLLSKQQVEMVGRYPAASAMYRAMMQAKDEEQGVLQEIFGESENILD